MNPRRLLSLLFFINVVNYLDRQVLSGVFPVLQSQFSLSDTALGALGSAFMITFVLTMLPFGAWSDRWLPNKVAGIGVFIWSLATLLSSAAWSYTSLFFSRALVGIGESAYAPTGNAMLSHAYPEKRRSLVLSLFNMGLPIGGALGVVMGGFIGAHWGWRPAFLVGGLPGMVLSWLIWRIPGEGVQETAVAHDSGSEPGAQETVQQHREADEAQTHSEAKAAQVNSKVQEAQAKEPPPADPTDGRPPRFAHSAAMASESALGRRIDLSKIIPLLWNRAYLYTCLAYAAISFVFGAFVLFIPLYFEREFGQTLTHATTMAGLIEVAAGITGAPVGGFVADWVRRRLRGGRAYTLVFAMVISAIFMELGVQMHSVAMLFFCAFFMLWQTGAAASVMLDAVNPLVWNTASAFSIFAMHLLGDVWSPVAVGAMSDHVGLQTTFSYLPILILVAGILFWFAGRNSNPARVGTPNMAKPV